MEHEASNQTKAAPARVLKERPQPMIRKAADSDLIRPILCANAALIVPGNLAVVHPV
jgi:hypothetical protein